MPKSLAACVVLAVSVAACNEPQKPSVPAAAVVQDTVKDAHTLSNADSITLSHLDLDLAVSFEQRRLSGTATWTLDNPQKLTTLRLDDHGLAIDSVFADGTKTTYVVGEAVPELGNQLKIAIGAGTKQVRIAYHTTDSAMALQWLSPPQTVGKKLPYLYTQSEAIFARTWIPCADGPGIRFTYDARIAAPKGMLALMSAENPLAKNDSGIYHFHMPIAIPAYLMALAVGDIAFREIDSRTGVYTEPGMLDKAAYELVDMGKMVTTAESLYGPYRWGRYDVLVQPPGFPIGGMENPKLTFSTPTIIAGDRSLVNLIAHELAHNWSGNLVTNKTWNDIWMNEGFTVYFERRITEAMTDKSYVDMLWELGYQDLEAEVAGMNKDNHSRDTWLKLDLKGRSGDDGLSDIPYEKGSLFLWLLEQNVGRAKWDEFLKKYFSEHAFKSITTEEFLAYLRANLIKGDSALEKKLMIDAWVYGPGIPANAPRADKARFNQVDSFRATFLAAPAGAMPDTSRTKTWTSNEWQYFLRGMPKTISAAQMAALDKAFRLTQTGNSEIADLWYVMAIRAKYQPAYPNMEKFLSSVGRQKFLEPLYRELMSTGQQALAKRWFEKYRQNYHPIAQVKMGKIVGGK